MSVFPLKIFNCLICKKMFASEGIKCTVQHAPGDCCHKYDVEMPTKAKELCYVCQVAEGKMIYFKSFAPEVREVEAAIARHLKEEHCICKKTEVNHG